MTQIRFGYRKDTGIELKQIVISYILLCVKMNKA